MSDKIPGFRDSAQQEGNPVIEELKALRSGLPKEQISRLTCAILRNQLSAALELGVNTISFRQLQDAVHFIHWEMPGNLVQERRN